MHFSKQCALGLSFVHMCDVVHRDLKSQNFLVGEHLNVKICDFGLARTVDELKSLKTAAAGTVSYKSCQFCQFLIGLLGFWLSLPCVAFCVPRALSPTQPQYMAPELWSSSAQPSKASDVYAFGILLCEIWEKEVPFDGLAAGDIKAAVLAGTRPKLSKATPAAVAALVQQCWAAQPASRPTMEKASAIAVPLSAVACV